MWLNLFVLLLVLVSFFRAFFSDTQYLAREVFFVLAIMMGLPLSVVYGPEAANTIFGNNQLGGFQPVAGFLIVFGLIMLFAYVLSSGLAQWIGPKDKSNMTGRVILGIMASIEGLLVVGSLLFATSIFSDKLAKSINNAKASKVAVSFAKWVYLDFVDIDKALESRKHYSIPPTLRIYGGKVEIVNRGEKAIIKYPIPDSIGGGEAALVLINPEIKDLIEGKNPRVLPLTDTLKRVEK